jgi:hypothetical protein
MHGIIALTCGPEDDLLPALSVFHTPDARLYAGMRRLH